MDPNKEIFKHKYLKYKLKYRNLKKQHEGGNFSRKDIEKDIDKEISIIENDTKAYSLNLNILLLPKYIKDLEKRGIDVSKIDVLENLQNLKKINDIYTNMIGIIGVVEKIRKEEKNNQIDILINTLKHQIDFMITYFDYLNIINDYSPHPIIVQIIKEINNKLLTSPRDTEYLTLKNVFETYDLNITYVINIYTSIRNILNLLYDINLSLIKKRNILGQYEIINKYKKTLTSREIISKKEELITIKTYLENQKKN